MSTSQPKIKKRRKVSYLPSIISIAMVLFMLGLFGIILINGNKLQQYLKENFQLTVFFKEDVPETEVQRIMANIQQQEYTKRAVFVSKQQAAEQFSKEIGQDFVGFLGFNPLLPSIELFLKSGFTSANQLKTVDIELRRNPEVQEVVYQQNILDEINKNVSTLGTILIALSIIFLIISITLINNTIRLNLYARRFIIKSMQMVGATHGFIIKPFVFKSVLHGLYGGIIACLLLGGVLYALPTWISGIEELYENTQFAILFGVVILVGIIISMISSAISTNHYLKLKIDDLY
ncbi:MAG: permease-like cell division protein FtsX [Bacteroidia bacterium]|nr:permease-like cell division protein FtsX [Bacteroidia bacterium]MBP9688550.1 permease-like cell division protein FtsX [Bacteroidia bacterium]